MTETPQVVIRDEQWLGSAELFADFGDKEVIVALDRTAKEHHCLTELPDNEKGQSMRSSREALHRVTMAATHAQARGSVDPYGRILIGVEDLKATE